MQPSLTRAGRRPLARTIVLLSSLGALAACGDETTAPVTNAPSRAAANTAAPSADPYTTSVDLSVGGLVPIYPYAGALVSVELTCSTNQLVNLTVDLEHEERQGGTKVFVQGSAPLVDVVCNEASGPYTVAVFPYFGTQFPPGRGTVRARVTSTQPGVEPASVTRRVRLVVPKE